MEQKKSERRQVWFGTFWVEVLVRSIQNWIHCFSLRTVLSQHSFFSLARGKDRNLYIYIYAYILYLFIHICIPHINIYNFPYALPSPLQPVAQDNKERGQSRSRSWIVRRVGPHRASWREGTPHHHFDLPSFLCGLHAGWRGCRLAVRVSALAVSVHVPIGGLVPLIRDWDFHIFPLDGVGPGDRGRVGGELLREK